MSGYQPVSRDDSGYIPQRHFEIPLGFLQRHVGMILAMLSAFFSSGMAVTARLLQNSPNEDDNFDAFQILFLRMSLTIGVVLWSQNRTYELKKLREGPDSVPPKSHFMLGAPEIRHLLVTRAVCGFFGVFGLYYALNYLELSDATVITFLTPVATSLLAWIFLKEKFTRSMAIGGMVAFFGVILIARPVFLFNLIVGSHDSSGVQPLDRLRSIGFSMLGVMGAASAFVTIRSIGKRAHPIINVQYFSTWCWLISFVALIYTGRGIRLPHDFQQVAFLLALTLCGFLNQLCMTGALTREKTAKVANITYTQIVWALLWDKLLWDNWPDIWSILGGTLIMGSAMWVAMKKEDVAITGGTEDVSDIFVPAVDIDLNDSDDELDEESVIGFALSSLDNSSSREGKECGESVEEVADEEVKQQ